MKAPKILKKIKWKRLIIIAVIIVAVAAVVINVRNQTKKAMNMLNSSNKTVSVETRDIKSILSSTGVVEPLNKYEVSTLKEGEIITADFEEGDLVQKGDILYQITAKDLDNQIENRETAVTRAEKAYEKAQSDYTVAQNNYNDALSKYNNASNKYGSSKVDTTVTGVVKSVFVKEGDMIQPGSQIAEVYDNSYMLLSVPFTAGQVTKSLIGKTALVTITGNTEAIKGEVTKVGNLNQTLPGNRIVKMVTIRVKNPGSITSSNTATATIGSLYCSSEGTFKELENTVITSDRSGEIASLFIEEESKITKGDAVLSLTNDSVDAQLDSYDQVVKSTKAALDSAKYAVETAKDGIQDAKTALEDEEESKVDYSITAPISGQIISKNKLAGDVINANSTDSLCVIYDLSALKFKMNVDELDILNIKVGQEVRITADALKNVELKGEITSVSLLSNANKGVTQYPVTVRIDEPGDLLPGMNVTGEIVTGEVKGAMTIPSTALMDGDVVYVEDPSVKKPKGLIPAGFKEVKVEPGITDGDYVQIISGLKGNEKLYANDAFAFAPPMGQAE